VNVDESPRAFFFEPREDAPAVPSRAIGGLCIGVASITSAAFLAAFAVTFWLVALFAVGGLGLAISAGGLLKDMKRRDNNT
jgi:hypothetical protein